MIYFPRGTYHVAEAVEINRSVTLLFEREATLTTDAVDLIQIIAGEHVRIEGFGGHGRLVNQRAGGGVSTVISLNHVRENARPHLRIKDMYLEGHRGIEAHVRIPDTEAMGMLEVLDSHLHCQDMHIWHRAPEMGSVRVENSRFTGDARIGVAVLSPVPGAAIVRNNVFENVGVRAIWLGGGEANSIDDGAVEHLRSVIVHDNQILGGGHGATERVLYINGILVYGHNVSIQNNIVRDFNRGEPVPGEPFGHHMQLDDGSYFTGVMIEDESRATGRRRMAGSAIYAKVRSGIISGNICTNSGWRSVIEVKTGGREPYVIVSNNLVDGSSLSKDGSYGFDSTSGRSMWINNLIYNMPASAFVVRDGFENNYINNVIFNAAQGFRLQGSSRADGVSELLMHNRYANVKEPVVGQSSRVINTTPPMIAVHSVDALPEPTEQERGRLALVGGDDGDRTYLCVLKDGHYTWREIFLHPGDAGDR